MAFFDDYFFRKDFKLYNIHVIWVVHIGGLVIVGSQWGDEGKGKVTDIMCEKSDLVVRYQGGNNAGHTVVVGEEVFKFHLMPSGVVHGKKCCIANGVVLDPRVLMKEIKEVQKRGITVDIMIDPLTQIILPYHNELDGASEKELDDKKIGTTTRGIGPAYKDKYGRDGIRFIDLLDEKLFAKKLKKNYEHKKNILDKIYGIEIECTYEGILEEYNALADKLRKYLGDVSKEVYDSIHTKKVLFESAQGTFLDISYGTYPYVTSSHPISGAVFTDVGFPPTNLDVIAIVKAYTTRVGSGPFLCELNDEVGDHLVNVGQEFGTTTGRKRRCGWLDLVMLKYSNRINGFTDLAITKLDVLTGLEKIKVGVKYTMDGEVVNFPLTIDQLEKCIVEYKEFDGFTITGKERTYDELEENAKIYLKFIEDYLGVKISIVSIGPKRSETIIV